MESLVEGAFDYSLVDQALDVLGVAPVETMSPMKPVKTEFEQAQEVLPEDSGDTASDEEAISTQEVKEDFLRFCKDAQERIGFQKLQAHENINGVSEEGENVRKVVQFLQAVLSQYNTLQSRKISSAHISHLSLLIGTGPEQVTQFIRNTRGKTVKRSPALTQKSRKFKKLSDLAKPKGGAAGARTQRTLDLTQPPAGATPEEGYDEDTFEEYCAEKLEEFGIHQRLRPSSDLRNESDPSVMNLKNFLEAFFNKFPKYQLWMIKRLDQLVGPNEQAIKNVLLTHFRKRFRGSNPTWAGSARTVAKYSGRPMRLPVDAAKGLGCSKCRYGKNGCGTCGYYPEGTVFPAKMQKKKLGAPKQKKPRIKREPKPRAPRPPKLGKPKLRLKVAPKEKVIKKKGGAKKTSKKATVQKIEEAKRLKMEQEKIEMERKLDMERQKNIDQVPCGRCVPYSKSLKKELRSSTFHMSKMTIATRRRNNELVMLMKRREKKAIASTASGPYSKRDRYQSNGRSSKEVQLNSLVRIGKSPVHAWGLFAATFIPKGTRVIEYIGELIRPSIAEIRQDFYEKNNIDDYLFRIGQHYVIDATLSGGPARYINHGCDPNCQPKQFVSERKIFIFAIKDIMKGEELCYNYKFEYVKDFSEAIPCTCGSSKCSGYMNWR